MEIEYKIEQVQGIPSAQELLNKYGRGGKGWNLYWTDYKNDWFTFIFTRLKYENVDSKR